MKRMYVQLDDHTYCDLKAHAFERGMSMAELFRQALSEYLQHQPLRPRYEDFTFVGSGSSIQGNLAPVSEQHDKALLQAL